MTREEFDKLYLNKVVHCDTEEKANEFLALADSVGYKWINGKSLIEENFWAEYKKETCYEVKKRGVMYCDVDFYKNDYQIIKYQLQPKFKVGDKVRVKDTQSFYNYDKIGVIERVDMSSGLPYFVNIYGDGWLWEMAEESLEKTEEEPTYKEETIDDIIEEIEYHQKAINVLRNRLKRKAKGENK